MGLQCRRTREENIKIQVQFLSVRVLAKVVWWVCYLTRSRRERCITPPFSHRARLLHYLPTSMQSHAITSLKWIPLQVLHEDTLRDKSRPTGCSIHRKSFDLLRAESNMQHYNWRPADELLTDSQRVLHPALSFKGTVRAQMKRAPFCHCPKPFCQKQKENVLVVFLHT